MNIGKSLLILLLSILIGIIASISCYLFSLLLNIVLFMREQNPIWMWLLPFLGFGILIGQKKFPSTIHWGVTHYLKEIFSPHSKASPLNSIWTFFSTLLIHLGGGSAGREGVGLIMNGSLTDGLIPFKKDSEERSILLQAGLSAGFAAMFGTPLTGLIFIFETQKFKGLLSWKRTAAILTAIVSSLLTGIAIHTSHNRFLPFQGVSFMGLGLMMIAVPLVAHLFYFCLNFVNQKSSILGDYKLAWGGLFISVIIYIFGHRYSGLGEQIILETLSSGQALPWDFLGKILLTALTLGFGFRGGEVTPLFFIGATLGASLGQMSGDLELAKIGMVSVLGALTHTPIATGVLAFELFGIHAVFPSLLLAWIGKKLLKDRHLYKPH